MEFHTRIRWVMALAGGLLLARTMAAHVVWSGLGADSNWTNPANWEGGVAPPNDGSEDMVFDSGQRTSVLVDVSQNVLGLIFDFSTGKASAYALLGSGTTLTIGTGGINVITGSVLTTSGADTHAVSIGGTVTLAGSLGVVLNAPQTWSVESGSSLDVNSTISSTGPLSLTGGGEITLSGNNTFTGGTELQNAALGIENDQALGTGALTISAPAEIFSTFGTRNLANALNLNTPILEVHSSGGDFRFQGPVTLGGSTTINNSGQVVYFTGPIGETGGSRSLTVSGTGGVVLSGANTYSGGTAVLSGGVFFGNSGAVPASGALSSALQGYTGIGFNTGVQAGFISKFSPANTLGTIGFDSAVGATSALIYAEPVDLTGFNSAARIGTATKATFGSTAVITPPALAGYRFGDGGGLLRIESKLTGLNNLTVDSSATGLPLMVRLANSSNDYVGITSVTRSGLVFETGAVSSGTAVGSFVLGNGGYMGTADPAIAVSTWLANFALTTTTGVIGLDSMDLASPRNVTGAFDLTLFTAGTSIALGTSSAVTISGSILPPLLQSDYHFSGYRGGWLTVNSALTGSRGLKIGSATGLYPDVDPEDTTRMSTVFLNGSNSHTGGTTVYGGRLVLGHANALGSGALTMDGTMARFTPRLETSLTSNPSFSNQLLVRDDFDIGGVNGFSWSGVIADGTTTGRIRKHGAFNLILTGNNSGFSGGFQINEGTVTFASNTAAGTGGLDLGSGSGIAAFTSGAPSVSRLQGFSSDSLLTLGTGTTLTINQAGDSTFRGQIQGSGGIVKAGSGTLRLESPGSYTGGTTITGGTVRIQNATSLGTNSVTLNGPTSRLELDAGVTLANSVAFGAGGGRLAGRGAFTSNVVLGNNASVAPGSSIGTLAFTNALTFGAGGSYDFEVQDALGTSGTGWDHIQVGGALSFTSTAGTPFTLNLISISSSGALGNPANFSSSSAYSWAIASAASFVNFNPSILALNASNFMPALNGGTFSFSTSGGNLLLNFTPVPEPSTWALLLAGLGLIGFRKLRRRS